jgi:hypothetical protein
MGLETCSLGTGGKSYVAWEQMGLETCSLGTGGKSYVAWEQLAEVT